mmetsp:Transcript_273/g.494  ORF Transcript_273/g.494 Transcript_273/m.494 type:complete len:88 (+) Transcript_273:300-563(+)
MLSRESTTSCLHDCNLEGLFIIFVTIGASYHAWYWKVSHSSWSSRKSYQLQELISFLILERNSCVELAPASHAMIPSHFERFGVTVC